MPHGHNHSIQLNTGAWMPVLALGTGFDHTPNGLSLADMIRTGLVQMGYRALETAEIYPHFETIGPVLRTIPRSSYFLSTKIDPTIGARQRRQCAEDGQGCFQMVVDASRETIRKLGVQHVDLLMLHRPPKRTAGGFAAQCARAREQWRALEHVKRELGLAHAIGTSNYCVELLRCVLEKAEERPSVMSLSALANTSAAP